jgi:hypothetical protein
MTYDWLGAATLLIVFTSTVTCFHVPWGSISDFTLCQFWGHSECKFTRDLLTDRYTAAGPHQHNPQRTSWKAGPDSWTRAGYNALISVWVFYDDVVCLLLRFLVLDVSRIFLQYWHSKVAIQSVSKVHGITWKMSSSYVDNERTLYQRMSGNEEFLGLHGLFTTPISSHRLTVMFYMSTNCLNICLSATSHGHPKMASSS